MKTTFLTVAASAALCLTMPGAAGVAPALADDDIDFVCYDTILPDGSEDLVCETIEDMKLECRLIDPEGTTPECAGLNDDKQVLDPVSPATAGTPNTLKSKGDTTPRRTTHGSFVILAKR